MMDSPGCPRSARAGRGLLPGMYCAPARTTSAPKVPPQQVIVCVEVFVVKSLAFPPEVPSTLAPDCACSFAGTTVTIAVPDAALLTCDTALTVTEVVILPPLPSHFVATLPTPPS